MDGPEVEGRVRELRRFAVKSMLGEVLDRCVVDETGIRGDRVYGLLDEETGMVASAKRCTANVPTPPDAPLIKTFCPG